MSQIIENVKVVGLGQACLDYLARVPIYPSEDSKMELMDLHIHSGGPASTALVTLSRLGITTSFLGSISNDYFGAEIVKGLKKEEVDTSFLKITPGYTSQFAFIVITRDTGNRTIFWHRGSVPHLKSKDVDLSLFPSAQLLHLDGLMIEASIEAARQARKMGIKVVLDAGTMREGSRELVPLVDVLIASEGFAEPLVGTNASPESSLKALRQLCPGDVIITLGSKGSMGYYDGEVMFQKALSVKAVDTTGAGDVYHGAYIYGILQGWDMNECMRFATVTSGLKCREIGAQKGIPRLDEIKKFLIC